jgi:hypothetical protein
MRAAVLATDLTWFQAKHACRSLARRKIESAIARDRPHMDCERLSRR